MKLGEWLGAALISLMIAVGVVWQGVRIDKLKDERDLLSDKLSAQQVISTTTFTAIAAHHRISLSTLKAKLTEGAEHVNVKTVIKTVLKESECAITPVPTDAINELRKYESGIRERASSTYPARTNR